jgi:hypothetical protein
MNEQIRLLAEQAFFDENTNQPSDKMYTFSEHKMQQFADMIVAECLKIAKTRENELESAGLLDESNAVGNVAYRISRQFGVKR